MTPNVAGLLEVIERGADWVPSPALPPLDQVREFIRASKAENTIRGYQSDWRAFCAWTDAHGLCAMPASPETVAAFIAECAGRLKVGSVQRRLNAIAEAHKALGLEPPTHSGIVANTMKGIRRTKGTAPVQKAAALTEDIRAMVVPRMQVGSANGIVDSFCWGLPGRFGGRSWWGWTWTIAPSAKMV